MTQEELVRITNCQNRINDVNDLNTCFLENLSKQLTLEDLPSEIKIDGDILLITSFNYQSESKAKIIKTEEDQFYCEYRFFIVSNEEEIEVWRFYLDSGGNLLSSIQPGNIICGYTNQYLSKTICKNVLLGTLASELFQKSS